MSVLIYTVPTKSELKLEKCSLSLGMYSVLLQYHSATEQTFALGY